MASLVLNLRRLRLAQGLTQAELARRAGLWQATVAEYERPTKRRVDLGVLGKLAKALHVPPVALLGLEQPMRRRKAARKPRRGRRP